MGRGTQGIFGSPTERFTRKVFSRIITSVAISLRENDLSVAQLALVYLLDERTDMRIGDVADELGRSQPAASRMVDDLVRQGLVSRKEDPDDRRARVLELTAQGRAFVARSSEARVITIAKVMKSMPANALTTLVELTQRKE